MASTRSTATRLATSLVGDTFLTLGITPSDDATTALAEGVTGSPASIGFLYLVLLTGANSDAPQITQLMNSTLTSD